MKWFRNTSVKTKLTLAISMACLPVLLSFAAFAWNDVRMIKVHLLRQSSTLADTLGANSVTALLFNDPEVAGEVLSSVRNEPSIRFACTYDRAGRVFARYGKASQLLPQLTLPIDREGIVLYGDDFIDVIKPIVHDEQQTGATLLRVGMSKLNQQIWQYAFILAAILIFATAVTLVATSLVHRAISQPIIHMAEAMQRVSANNEYTCRVEKQADDEIGVLSDGFNNMLAQIGRLMGNLKKQAFNDALTGLPNRAAILKQIQDVIDQGENSHYALLFLDFDRFKLINDSLGHDVGDELLREISRRLRATLRESDEIASARLGGDEFVVLLNNLDSPTDGTVVAERLLKVFSKSYRLGPHTVYSTASIGVVTSEYHYESAVDMLRDADLAMYEAKAAGRGCYVIFDKTMRDKSRMRLRIEGELREAILREEFTLFYQPIVSLESCKLEGIEALIRWVHPDRGMISPDDFIPVAEETGLILSIGEWVLDEALRQFADWQTMLGDDAPPCMHVNVSRMQLLLPNLVENVEELLAKYAIPPACLHLEVTESMIMHDRRTTIAVLNRLREVGVRIDMDDFGTGYSSLSCLHEFPIDVLKIDRSFVSSLKDVRDFTALLHAILTLADNLNLQVVSEGIEDAAQLATLQALGCEYGQGYLFAKPLPADELVNYIYTSNKMILSQPTAPSTLIPMSFPADEPLPFQQGEVER